MNNCKKCGLPQKVLFNLWYCDCDPTEKSGGFLYLEQPYREGRLMGAIGYFRHTLCKMSAFWLRNKVNDGQVVSAKDVFKRNELVSNGMEVRCEFCDRKISTWDLKALNIIYFSE